jgi:hypothetical protein
VTTFQRRCSAAAAARRALGTACRHREHLVGADIDGAPQFVLRVDHELVELSTPFAKSFRAPRLLLQADLGTGGDEDVVGGIKLVHRRVVRFRASDCRSYGAHDQVQVLLRHRPTQYLAQGARG